MEVIGVSLHSKQASHHINQNMTKALGFMFEYSSTNDNEHMIL